MIKKEILDSLRINSLMGMGYSSPNPPVACTITDLDDNILSEAYTQKVGENHAEKEAYRKLGNNFHRPHKVYVTLEPCSHFGKTPPCLDLILTKKPQKIIIGSRDPNPLVQKKDSIKALEEKGIIVEISNDLREVSYDFLSGFFNRIQTKYPTYFFKLALSKSGFFTSGELKNIQFSTTDSMNLTQFIRQSIDAIIVGPATVYSDSPSLNFRNIESIIHEETYIKDIYFSTILEVLKNKEYVQEINHRNNQPLRLYVISEKYFPNELFFKKLEILDKTKSIFILIDNLREENELNLKKLTTFPLVPFKDLDKLIKDLNLNTLLVEGGNLVIEFFMKTIKNKDKIIEIETEKELFYGKKPYYNNDQKIKLLDKFKVASDLWKIKGY